MEHQTHWGKVLQDKAADAISWSRTHLEQTLALIIAGEVKKEQAGLNNEKENRSWTHSILGGSVVQQR